MEEVGNLIPKEEEEEEEEVSSLAEDRMVEK